MKDNGLAQLMALSGKWFPGRQVDTDCMAEALFLETDYWEKMQASICNGIVKAFDG